MLKRRRVFAAKHEAVTGTAEPLVTADANMVIYDPLIQPNVGVHQRMNPGSLGTDAAVMSTRAGTCTFRTELTGDGAGGVPQWAETLFPACGYYPDPVNPLRYIPRSIDFNNADARTLTMATYQGEQELTKRLVGASGTWKFAFKAGEIIGIDWNFQGIFEEPTTGEDIGVPDYPTELPFRFASADLQIEGELPRCTDTIELESGGEVVLRPCGTELSGYAGAIITDRKPVGKIDPESVDNVGYGPWLNGEEHQFLIAVQNATDRIEISAPKFQRTNIQEGDRAGIQTDDITFQFNTDIADDELAITFGPPVAGASTQRVTAGMVMAAAATVKAPLKDKAKAKADSDAKAKAKDIAAAKAKAETESKRPVVPPKDNDGK